MLDNIDEISGAKRKENLTTHAEAARISKMLATAQRDVPVDLDLDAEARPRARPRRLREVFREFELRDPLRRLEEAFGEDAAAPAPPRRAARSGAKLREGSLADVAGLDGELTVARARGRAARGPAVRRGASCASASRERRGARRRDGRARGRRRRASARDPVVAHDAKALRDVPPNLVHDTLLAAYLLEPARRGYPFRELVEERGLAADVEDPAGADARADARAGRPGSASSSTTAA